MNNKAFEKFVINYYGDLPKILKNLDIEVQFNGLFFCPMHDNYNTPAAKLFKDENGWCFYCFSEHRIYNTYDIYKEIYKTNMKQLFNNLWEKLSESDKSLMKDKFGEFSDSGDIENLDLFKMFKDRRISYSNLIKNLENRLN